MTGYTISDNGTIILYEITDIKKQVLKIIS
jgi:hypothetical protein